MRHLALRAAFRGKPFRTKPWTLGRRTWVAGCRPLGRDRGMLAAVIGLSTIVRPHESPVSVDPQEVAAHDLRVGERRDGVPSPEWHAELESIDGWSARGHVAVARPAGSRRPVVFRGWVVHDPTRSSPRDVRIQVGDRAWNATSGLIREDRPKRFCGGIVPAVRFPGSASAGSHLFQRRSGPVVGSLDGAK